MNKIVVLGGGESGVGSAVLAKVKGFDVFLSDMGKINDRYRNMLVEWDIAFEDGKHSESEICTADLIIKSPGIPDKAPLIKKLTAMGIPIISEIEFAGRYSNAKTICITGSNGKTTTTTLIYKIMRDAGMNVGLAGNIGHSYAFQVATCNFDWYVIELSSFQLDGMFDFRADIGVLMNITPDHLDRYNYILQNYANSKFRIIRNQGADDTFIYCGDDPITMQNIVNHALPMESLAFTAKGYDTAVAEFVYNKITVRRADAEVHIDMNRTKISGIHNAYNIMAAALSTLKAGVSAANIEQSIYDFGGVEHRLEVVGEVNGILYINDSKATNVDSSWYALESMKRPVIWIAGGTDKGNDYEPLKDFATKKVKALICMGLNNEKLKESFIGVIPRVYDTDSLEMTMKAISEVAVSGDVVLLSPACASFDLFKNYEDRGDKFKTEVLKIQQK